MTRGERLRAILLRASDVFDRRDWTMLLGLLLLASGLGQIWPPLAQVAPGTILVAAALGLSFVHSKGGA